MRRLAAPAFVCTALLAGAALATLAPLSDDAKAKAAEAAQKAAWTNKVADFQLCKAMDRAAAKYHASAKQSGKDMAPVETPPCADPGPFVPPAAASAPTAAAAPPAAAPAPAAAPDPKKS